MAEYYQLTPGSFPPKWVIARDNRGRVMDPYGDMQRRMNRADIVGLRAATAAQKLAGDQVAMADALARTELAQRGNMFGAGLAEDARQFDVNQANRVGLANLQAALSRERMGEGARQFDVGTEQRGSQFDRTLAAQQEQFGREMANKEQLTALQGMDRELNSRWFEEGLKQWQQEHALRTMLGEAEVDQGGRALDIQEQSALDRFTLGMGGLDLQQQELRQRGQQFGQKIGLERELNDIRKMEAEGRLKQADADRLRQDAYMKHQESLATTDRERLGFEREDAARQNMMKLLGSYLGVDPRGGRDLLRQQMGLPPGRPLRDDVMDEAISASQNVDDAVSASFGAGASPSRIAAGLLRDFSASEIDRYIKDNEMGRALKSTLAWSPGMEMFLRPLFQKHEVISELKKLRTQSRPRNTRQHGQPIVPAPIYPQWRGIPHRRP